MGTLIGSLVLFAEGVIGFLLMDGIRSSRGQRRSPAAGTHWWTKDILPGLAVWDFIEGAPKSLDLLSFTFLFGFGGAALKINRFQTTRVFFALAWVLLAIRLIAMSYKRLRGLWKWLCVVIVYVLVIVGTIYLLGWPDDAQSDYLMRMSQDEKIKYDAFMNTHKHFPEVYPWLNYLSFENHGALQLLVREAPTRVNTPSTLFHVHLTITMPIATDLHYLLSCVILDKDTPTEEWGGGDEKPIAYTSLPSARGVIFQTGLSERDGSWQGKLTVKYLVFHGIANAEPTEIEQMFVRDTDAGHMPFSHTERYTVANGWGYPAYSTQNRDTSLSVEELEAVGVPMVQRLSTDPAV